MIFFQTKDHAFILEGSKRNELGTCDSDDEMPKGKLCMKECHWLRDCVLFKEWLQKKRILGYWSKKRDRSMRVFIEKCLLCTLCVKKNLFSVSLMRVVKVIYMFNLTNIGLNMCVKRIFGFISEFDDWTRANPDIYVHLRELSHMTGKVCDSTRMAEKDWENTRMAG